MQTNAVPPLTTVWVVIAEWRCSYFCWFTHGQKKQSMLFTRAEEKVSERWSRMKTCFTVSIYCTVYCKDYHMIALGCTVQHICCMCDKKIGLCEELIDCRSTGATTAFPCVFFSVWSCLCVSSDCVNQCTSLFCLEVVVPRVINYNVLAA